MTGIEVEEFTGGSLRITAQPWVLIGDGPLRVPVNAREVFGGTPRELEASAQEITGLLGATEERRLAAAQAAATSALLYAGGAAPAGFTLLDSPDAFAAAPPELPDAFPLTVLIAAVLAGQLAKDRALRGADARVDPLRLVAATMFGGKALAHLPTLATDPVALLYGALACAPDDWPGRAVHMDYLREETRAWITENAVRIDALAEQALVSGVVDAAVIEQVLSGDGTGQPLRTLTPQHPLRRPTPIPPEAIDTVADYWSAVLRHSLERTAAQQAQADPARAGDDERRVQVFRRTLAEQITVRIELREPRGDRRIEKSLYEDESYTPYSVGVHYESDAVIQDALIAAGLDPSKRIGLLTSVEFDRNTVTEYLPTDAGGRSATVLWQADSGHAPPATT